MLLSAALPASRALAQADGASAPATASVSFSFDRAGVQVPHYTIVVREDGTGTYKGIQATPPSPYPGVSTPSPPIDRTFVLTSATTHTIFALAHELRGFRNVQCASKAKNIADTGTKVLAYDGPEGQGSCTYNYSDNKNVVHLTSLFEGITETMDQGRLLDHLHRYDRLGLDEAINFLAEEVTDGRALEVGTIEETLRSIAGDAEVMRRVRAKANSLLSLTGTGSIMPGQSQKQ